MLVLGLVAIGGIGVASSIASSGESNTGVSGGNIGFKPFAGIVGSNKATVDTGDNAGVTSIVLPPEPSVTFPAPPTYQAPTYSPMPTYIPQPVTETGGSYSKTAEIKKSYATGLQKAVMPTGTTPTNKMEAVGFMSGLGLRISGVIPAVGVSGGSNSNSNSKTKSEPKKKKREIRGGRLSSILSRSGVRSVSRSGHSGGWSVSSR